MRVANLLGRRRLQKFKKPIAKKMIKTIGRRGTNPEISSGQVLTLEREAVDVGRGNNLLRRAQITEE